MPEIIFSKKEFQTWDFENPLYFGPSFAFWRTALGRFNQFFFLRSCLYFLWVLISANGQIVLQVINNVQGKCHSRIGQSFAQKSSIGKQWITIYCFSRNRLKLLVIPFVKISFFDIVCFEIWISHNENRDLSF